MGIVGENLQAAIDKKSNDITTFVWKEERIKTEDGKSKQSERRMIDMSESELQKAYNYCKTMLFNSDPKRQGRYKVLELISNQKDKCGAELFLRYIEQNTEMSRFTLLSSINEFLAKNKEALKGYSPVVSDVFSSVPDEYNRIPLDLIVDGCLDRLGTLDKKHITRSFVLRQGIWLTPAEAKDLSEPGINGKMRDKIEVVRERLNLKETERLRINSTGLNYTQMRAILNIKPDRKYLDLTTSQLETLRYRILFGLEEVVTTHIASWEKLMENIETVAETKNFKVS